MHAFRHVLVPRAVFFGIFLFGNSLRMPFKHTFATWFWARAFVATLSHSKTPLIKIALQKRFLTMSWTPRNGSPSAVKHIILVWFKLWAVARLFLEFVAQRSLNFQAAVIGRFRNLLTVSARIIERKLGSTKLRLFTVPCCSIILFSSEGMKKNVSEFTPNFFRRSIIFVGALLFYNSVFPHFSHISNFRSII